MYLRRVGYFKMPYTSSSAGNEDEFGLVWPASVGASEWTVALPSIGIWRAVDDSSLDEQASPLPRPLEESLQERAKVGGAAQDHHLMPSFFLEARSTDPDGL